MDPEIGRVTISKHKALYIVIFGEVKKEHV